MDADTYFERIGYTGTRERNPDLVRRLHRAHLLAVAFENLDIPLGRPIALWVPAIELEEGAAIARLMALGAA